MTDYNAIMARIFQSTLPVRGATRRQGTPLAVRGISIHAPRTGSDQADHADGHTRPQFQSTLPVRGATLRWGSMHLFTTISIHAPRTGSDNGRLQRPWSRYNFNPRSPYGERHGRLQRPWSRYNFNPRSPYGERQACEASHMGLSVISIHAPRTGSDP